MTTKEVLLSLSSKKVTIQFIQFIECLNNIIDEKNPWSESGKKVFLESLKDHSELEQVRFTSAAQAAEGI